MTLREGQEAQGAWEGTASVSSRAGCCESVLKESESRERSWVLETPQTYETMCLEGVCVCAQKEGDRVGRGLTAGGVKDKKK